MEAERQLSKANEIIAKQAAHLDMIRDSMTQYGLSLNCILNMDETDWSKNCNREEITIYI